MNTIQQYFEANFSKCDKYIKFTEINEKLLGNTLTIENYLLLEILDVKELEQLEQIIIKNCPNLKNINCKPHQHQNPIIIQPNKKNCDWRCFAIASLLLWNCVLTFLFYQFVKKVKTRNSKKQLYHVR